MEERPRFLHRHPAFGYTAAPSVGARGEGEAVPADYQELLSARPAREAVAAWSKVERKIVALLDDFDAHPHAARRELRNARRTLDAVGRRLGA